MEQAIIEIGPHIVRFRGVDGFWLGQSSRPTRFRGRRDWTLWPGSSSRTRASASAWSGS